MRIILFFAVLGLLIAEAFLLPRTIRDLKTMRKMRAEAASEAGLPLSLSPFAGFDTKGRPLTLVTDDTRWIVPVMIHSERLVSDLDYLSRLRKAAPNKALTLVGVCDHSQCGDGLPPGWSSSFPLLAYGSYAP